MAKIIYPDKRPQYWQQSLKDLSWRLRKFRQYAREEVLADLMIYNEDISNAISKAIVNQLYMRGINGEGVKIMDYQPYKESTIERKKRKGQPTTRVTLRDKGDFHEMIVPTIEGKYLKITSLDEKTNMLVDKYGKDIFTLTNDNLKRILDVHVRPILQKKLRDALKLEQ